MPNMKDYYELDNDFFLKCYHWTPKCRNKRKTWVRSVWLMSIEYGYEKIDSYFNGAPDCRAWSSFRLAMLNSVTVKVLFGIILYCLSESKREYTYGIKDQLFESCKLFKVNRLTLLHSKSGEIASSGLNCHHEDCDMTSWSSWVALYFLFMSLIHEECTLTSCSCPWSTTNEPWLLVHVLDPRGMHPDFLFMSLIHD